MKTQFSIFQFSIVLSKVIDSVDVVFIIHGSTETFERVKNQIFSWRNRMNMKTFPHIGLEMISIPKNLFNGEHGIVHEKCPRKMEILSFLRFFV